MPRNLSLDEDIALKRLVTMPRDQKPDFSWRESLAVPTHPLTGITVTRTNGDEQSFNLSDVADEIGEALTDLLLSREEKNIFNEQNRGFVANVAHSVALSLAEQAQKGGSLRLSEHDLSLLIEKALIENDAHDVAKSLVFKRSIRSGSASPLALEAEQLNVRLIRRNGSVVPWMESKIEAACRRAFLSMKENAEAAAAIARGVSDRVRTRDSAFVHIEDVQDLVQEELMRQGYYKVAESYILYRAQRASHREDVVKTEAEAETTDLQESLIMVTMRDGQSVLWDGSELRKRIQFAMIGLDLNLDALQIERELRRSLATEVTEDILKNT
ncbi:MAG: ribonucleoside-diphosphate reductase subunit alpha, partial [Proteobacteria bacterium]|nr:ribonucleoside-diphosphate reductase subunit alpha [Pseudomonadota bacterium]